MDDGVESGFLTTKYVKYTKEFQKKWVWWLAREKGIMTQTINSRQKVRFDPFTPCDRYFAGEIYSFRRFPTGSNVTTAIF